ncbi:MAG: bifunctional tetrahydrofolate synthase/dihydrofolate synthase [Salinisphaera sp.]|nr:bifunctional tetrahydrofolate synthase/dihydrofolate synthase [Salinisphaera sp.]
MSAVLQPATLDEWLHWQESLHPRSIELGLERVGEVADRLGLRPFPARVITVGGTNGKGSCALLLEALLGGRVGTYTSPHLLRYNERIRIDGIPVADSALVTACEEVEQARGDTALTYFEFGTLAALWLFARAGLDTVVLEVGMGGRLDAVNILDADVALVTNVGLDHVDWLGADREAIGREKAGIYRRGRPAVCADRDPPASLVAAGARSQFHRLGGDFNLGQEPERWCWRDWQGRELTLAPMPNVLPDNLAAALAVLTALGVCPQADALHSALAGFCAPGRRQRFAGEVEMVLDVAHNTEAMALLATWLADHPVPGRTRLVVGMLANKPVAEATQMLAGVADEWYAAGLPQTDRGLDGAALAAQLPAAAMVCADAVCACTQARAASNPGDRVVVCGSFYTVGAILAHPEAELWMT